MGVVRRVVNYIINYYYYYTTLLRGGGGEEKEEKKKSVTESKHPGKPNGQYVSSIHAALAFQNVMAGKIV